MPKSGPLAGGIEPGPAGIHHLRRRDAKPVGHALADLDPDDIAGPEAFENAEMGVAVSADDTVAGLAGQG